MNEIKNYAYIDNLELSEYLAFPIYIVIILLISYYIQNNNVRKNPVYKYYTWGVAAKLFGAVVFCLVYIFVYKGGDTISYFETSRALTNLLIQKPFDFFKVIMEKPGPENYFLFDSRTTGFPWSYMYYDPKTFFVAKLLVPFMLISFQSYMLASIMLSWATFTGIWRLFLVFAELYKKYSKQLAFSILFVPSAVFWGSGILKDSITLSASCWFIYALFNFFIVKKKRTGSMIILLISAFVLVSIKPYILFALLPGALIWIFNQRISNLKNKILKYSIIPFIFILSFTLGFYILSVTFDFNIEKSISDAAEKQNDLKQSYYGGNSFDIGSYDPSISGALQKAPLAIISSMYRPFIWEAKNVVMLISGLENLIILYLSVLIIIRLKVKKILSIIFNNPIILFSLSYSVFLAFVIGLSTANFGALVRFKIAYLPEFASGVIILFYLVKDQKKRY